jgi:flagellar hook capping protein FlgD
LAAGRFKVRKLVLVAAGLMLLAGPQFAYAWHLSGRVFCDGTGLPLGGVTVQVNSTDGGGFTGLATSDDGGGYFVELPNTPGCYRATTSLGAGESVISPASGYFDFCTTADAFEIGQDWVISSPACSNEGCWLTGGGAKFSQITSTLLGTSTRAKTSKDFNWGGNVNPGCSPTAGQGGQWNTIDADKKLHFQGFAIQVVRCGNVDGIPPGSTSPVTPFNFIEFTGTGRVKGIQGNKADYPLVYFFARAEDRNEPGSNGQRDGAGKDRYFLNVYTDPSNPTGTSLILVDQDLDPATVDPLIITDGNMQIHVSSCTTPAPALVSTASGQAERFTGPATSILPSAVEFATSPNPGVERSVLRYALPRESQVSLRVFDVGGRVVVELESGVSSAGQHAVTWNLRDRGGVRVAKGIYFARLVVNGVVYSRNVVVGR